MVHWKRHEMVYLGCKGHWSKIHHQEKTHFRFQLFLWILSFHFYSSLRCTSVTLGPAAFSAEVSKLLGFSASIASTAAVFSTLVFSSIPELVIYLNFWYLNSKQVPRGHFLFWLFNWEIWNNRLVRKRNIGAVTFASA